MVKSGDQFPRGVKLAYIPYDEELAKSGACGVPRPLNLDTLLDKRFLIVSVPGAFTPTCSENHIPPFLEHLGDLKKKIDEIIVLSANDPFVLNAWSKNLKAYNGNVKFASDPNAQFSKSLGLSADLTSRGMGVRTMRYAMLVNNGKIEYVGVEDKPGVTVSGYDSVKAKL